MKVSVVPVLYPYLENILSQHIFHKSRVSGSALGRPKKDAVRDRRQDYLDKCERVEVERRFKEPLIKSSHYKRAGKVIK